MEHWDSETRQLVKKAIRLELRRHLIEVDHDFLELILSLIRDGCMDFMNMCLDSYLHDKTTPFTEWLSSYLDNLDDYLMYAALEARHLERENSDQEMENDREQARDDSKEEIADNASSDEEERSPNFGQYMNIRADTEAGPSNVLQNHSLDSVRDGDSERKDRPSTSSAPLAIEEQPSKQNSTQNMTLKVVASTSKAPSALEEEPSKQNSTQNMALKVVASTSKPPSASEEEPFKQNMTLKVVTSTSEAPSAFEEEPFKQNSTQNMTLKVVASTSKAPSALEEEPSKQNSTQNMALKDGASNGIAEKRSEESPSKQEDNAIIPGRSPESDSDSDSPSSDAEDDRIEKVDTAIDHKTALNAFQTALKYARQQSASDEDLLAFKNWLQFSKLCSEHF